MYDDTVAQMKAAQDRRNELARDNSELERVNGELVKENERLRAEIDGLQKKAADAQAEAVALADKTLQARSK